VQPAKSKRRKIKKQQAQACKSVCRQGPISRSGFPGLSTQRTECLPVQNGWNVVHRVQELRGWTCSCQPDIRYGCQYCRLSAGRTASSYDTILQTVSTEDCQYCGLPVLRTVSSTDCQTYGLPVLRTVSSYDCQYCGCSVVRTVKTADCQ
jgi:hypothetical protein